MSQPSREQLVNFVQWCRQEALELAAMPTGGGQDERLAKFNVRTGAFDKLPRDTKLEAIDGKAV